MADVIFLLDSSGSVGLDNWKKVLQFTKDLIGSFKLGDDSMRVGVASYGSGANVNFNLIDYTNHNAVNNAIDQIPWKDQETNTSGAVRLMYRDMFTEANGDRPGVPNLGLVVTDGASNRDEHLTIPEADNARALGNYTK